MIAHFGLKVISNQYIANLQCIARIQYKCKQYKSQEPKRCEMTAQWLKLLSGGQCRVRYDNERGKGDHRHFNEVEAPYIFVSIDRLLDDFQHDVENWS